MLGFPHTNESLADVTKWRCIFRQLHDGKTFGEPSEILELHLDLSKLERYVKRAQRNRRHVAKSGLVQLHLTKKV